MKDFQILDVVLGRGSENEINVFEIGMQRLRRGGIHHVGSPPQSSTAACLTSAMRSRKLILMKAKVTIEYCTV